MNLVRLGGIEEVQWKEGESQRMNTKYEKVLEWKQKKTEKEYRQINTEEANTLRQGIKIHTQRHIHPQANTHTNAAADSYIRTHKTVKKS